MNTKTIVGNGQLAKSFTGTLLSNIVIFASGVSNSNCIDIGEFEREKNLLLKYLQSNEEKRFVYFSSCALSASDYELNDYYRHKLKMEKLIKENSNNYYIFRFPQLFGDLILHKTLINFIYKSIKHEHKFKVYSEAYRYVIEINDVRKLVESYLKCFDRCITVDLANPYRYKVIDIVNIFEKLLNKKAIYEIVEKKDSYLLDLSDMNSFIKDHNIDNGFGKDYFVNKLKEKIR